MEIRLKCAVPEKILRLRPERLGLRRRLRTERRRVEGSDHGESERSRPVLAETTVRSRTPCFVSHCVYTQTRLTERVRKQLLTIYTVNHKNVAVYF